ncbi:PHB depolymerase family esterase [Loktanella sp. SALINAS62]|uniref:extracellular catalytic domain type 1 short-chain-length polyhydroxyalkanoate depolymerase n=1 Tax=Loktanella sp. SALINAS62 TaxID=2706124 RepID=UPI001B8CA183|nr:PHB depolymerase family esterase [Loktanella sp. SALINAS62]MBS1301155.1 PHB depolymerase family esterase [Loktanella sp. SALINAS62]
MLKLNLGAMRRATDAARITDANDLVRRTLAQHGLMPDALPAGPQARRTPVFGDAPAMADLPAGAGFAARDYAGSDGSRRYWTYVPATAPDGITGVIVMLHGCTQTPQDFATGTGMNALAETHRLVIVYPQQSRGDNAQSCWNWFRRGDQMRDRGEPAILAGIARRVAAEHGVPHDRVYAAGLSAGAAMAVILGQSYPDVFAAIGVHAGLPYGAAKDVPSAFAAMAGRSDAGASGFAARAAVPTIQFHGTADATVHPTNADSIMRDTATHGPAQTIETSQTGSIGGRSYQQTTVTDTDGRPLSEDWRIDGLGHAWSGGQAGGSYTDTSGPDASTEMVRFFQQISPKG